MIRLRLQLSDWIAFALLIAIAVVASRVDWPAADMALAAMWGRQVVTDTDATGTFRGLVP